MFDIFEEPYTVFLVAQLVKNLPAMQETQVQSLGGEDPLEKEMATHCSILTWRIPMDRGAWFRCGYIGITLWVWVWVRVQKKTVNPLDSKYIY